MHFGMEERTHNAERHKANAYWIMMRRTLEEKKWCENDGVFGVCVCVVCLSLGRGKRTQSTETLLINHVIHALTQFCLFALERVGTRSICMHIKLSMKNHCILPAEWVSEFINFLLVFGGSSVHKWNANLTQWKFSQKNQARREENRQEDLKARPVWKKPRREISKWIGNQKLFAIEIHHLRGNEDDW